MTHRLTLALSLLLCLAGCQCGTDTHPDGGGSADAGALDGGATDAGPVDAGPTLYDDFPAAPVLVGLDGGVPSAFAATDGGPAAGPCVSQPQPGSLFPKNFLRPRFTWSAPAGQTIFELRVTTPLEREPLVVYTTATSWTLPASIWLALQSHVVDAPITFSVRGLTPGATPIVSQGTTGAFRIAPASAAGSIVYWTTTGGTRLKGFSMGDESVTTILQPSQAQVQCVGCHSSTPDGLYAAFSAGTNPNNGNESGVGLRSVDGNASEPPFLTDSARALLTRQQQQAPVFSKAHWDTGDRVLVSEFLMSGRFELIWTDLETSSQTQGAGWGVLARTGDEANAAGSATFSHDGSRVVYVSSNNIGSGVTAGGDGNLKWIPWNARAGGTATAIAGASDPDFVEYYPTFSSDDAWLAFSRLAQGQNSYNNALAEVFVVPADGGVATRLSANDPDQCSTAVSPGLTNSWPKWSPEATTFAGKTYYWLTFSSTRGAGGRPQLYVSPVVVEGGVPTTYPALYLWNQPADEANHTPAWDVFEITIN